MLSKLIAMIMAHPQVGPQFIQRLSETYPIRKAARFTAYVYLRGKKAVEDGARDVSKNPNTPMVKMDMERFKNNFKEELRKGVNQAKEDMKRK